ncbi:hypothetical protein Ngar_c20320 [Candidatus Nitrososphaera gargensis Ga9.2]|uniref:Uncharacterized protein n=1 Tax=Nitrososphaera gargensis (strain Ga9.2) TaxID=1237085 RepID=K0IN91_NITGG|nr:hypothetical protein [Candidatus Nitrososphaera gargensis]AFU58964.1 hypothetical protein Ngar_c20320 [Candidatus Nitrososphaera gargensis Ga9.2]
MSDSTIPLDHDALSGLLSDPVMIRVVTVVNLASLSILELLEYGFTRKDVNRAMAKGVIEFDKPATLSAPETMSKSGVVQHVLETGDYYFGVLSSKVKLTKLGLYMLEIIEADTQSAIAEGSLDEPEQEARSQFSKLVSHR